MKNIFNLSIVALLLLSTIWAATNKNSHEKFDVQPGQKLSIEAKTGGDIKITGWNKNVVEVDVKVKGSDSKNVGVTIEKTSNGVRVEVEFIDRDDDHHVDVKIIISVPNKFDVDFETMGGDIKLKNIAGELDGSTMGGDLTLDELKGSLSISTMGGDIKLSNSTVNGKVQTMGGDISIKNVEGDIDAETMGGDITQTNVKSSKTGGDPIKIKTMGGDIKVDEAANGLNVKTMGGDVDINKVSKFCEAETMGGDIEIKLLDGWIEAKTMGGDIKIKMSESIDGKRSAKLTSMGGDITLYVPADLSMNIELEVEFDDRHENNVEIINDFGLSIEKEFDDDDEQYLKVNTQINGGRNKIKIKTHNGKIFLKKT